MARVDYNKIAELYDEPMRDHSPDQNLLEFLRTHLEILPSGCHVLDVGCGTGKQLTANRALFPDMPMTGLDLFEGMIRIAQKRCRSIDWITGDGRAMPFARASFNYACNEFSYPHVPEKDRLFHEICRVLKPGGRFALVNIDPWSMPNWIIYRYFPSAREQDHRDFLTVDGLSALLKEAGFGRVKYRKSHRTEKQDLREFLQYASQRHRASQLMVISDADYYAGIELLRRITSARSECGLIIESESCLMTMTADKL